MAASEPFRVRIAVRGYEIDFQGHVSGAVYLNYAEHARWECLRAAGVEQRAMAASGIAPVRLEERIGYRRELRAGDEVDVSCAFVWGSGKTFRVEQEFRRSDGELAAELTNVGGLLDLHTRRLLDEPARRWRALARSPGLIGL